MEFEHSLAFNLEKQNTAKISFENTYFMSNTPTECFKKILKFCDMLVAGGEQLVKFYSKTDKNLFHNSMKVLANVNLSEEFKGDYSNLSEEAEVNIKRARDITVSQVNKYIIQISQKMYLTTGEFCVETVVAGNILFLRTSTSCYYLEGDSLYKIQDYSRVSATIFSVEMCNGSSCLCKLLHGSKLKLTKFKKGDGLVVFETRGGNEVGVCKKYSAVLTEEGEIQRFMSYINELGIIVLIYGQNYNLISCYENTPMEPKKLIPVDLAQGDILLLNTRKYLYRNSIVNYKRLGKDIYELEDKDCDVTKYHKPTTADILPWEFVYHYIKKEAVTETRGGSSEAKSVYPISLENKLQCIVKENRIYNANDGKMLYVGGIHGGRANGIGKGYYNCNGTRRLLEGMWVNGYPSGKLRVISKDEFNGKFIEIVNGVYLPVKIQGSSISKFFNKIKSLFKK